ncbi:histidine phosphatase family protein [Lysobacter enzymogenes]|nr:histidine phosphatase family protein [Lysobacter enzymogenes]
MDRIAAFAFAVAAATTLAGCASAPAAPSSPAARYILVRHAEKASDDPRDPTLSAAGLERAQRLAARLREEPLGAVYVTGYRRTCRPASPPRGHGLTPIVYDAKSPAAQFAAQLRRERPPAPRSWSATATPRPTSPPRCAPARSSRCRKPNTTGA